MSSASISDGLVDELLSISAEMNKNFIPKSALPLMCDIRNQRSEFFESLFPENVASDSLHVYNNVQRETVVYPVTKNVIHNNLGQNKFSFSPHVHNIVNDSMRFLMNQSEMLHSLFNCSNISDGFKFDSDMQFKQNCSNPLTSQMKETDISLVKYKPEVKMADIKDITLKPKSTKINDKINVPSSVALNLELANRKTKEMQKRSKKRRRRQKKVQQTANNQSVSFSEKIEDCESSFCFSSHKSKSKNTKNENGFASVESEVPMSSSLLSSFVISVGNVSDNDSDWDHCSESNINTGIEEFEFSGLVITNLSSNVCLHSYSVDVECGLSAFSGSNETAKFQAALLKVNRNWNEATKKVNSNPKIPSKVSFAPEDQLVEVLPVEICERKGEWETYAIERLRFKRRIEEVEKIISPCLAAKHRSAVYKKIMPFL